MNIAESLLLRHANLITLAEAGVLNNVDVRVVDGLIAEIGRDLPSGESTVIDAAGRYVMPGIIDTHVHLNRRSQLPLFLSYGVTTVRNMSGSAETLEWKQKIASGEMTGPRIFTTGQITDGIMFWPGFRIVRTPEEAEKAVLDDIKAGFDAVKTYPDMPREAFVKLMETANKHGIKVVGHGSNILSAQEMIDLGYYSLEHVSRLPPNNDEDVVRLAKSEMWWVPTLVALRNVVGYIKGGLEIEHFAHTDLVGASVVESWRPTVAAYRADKRFNTFDLDLFSHLTRLYRQYSDRITVGTDVGVPGLFAGLAAHHELELLVSLGGLSPTDALLSGTVRAARLLGRESELGSVEVGKIADLLILEANPLDSISNTRQLGGVISAGRYFDGNKLVALVEECKSMVKTEQA